VFAVIWRSLSTFQTQCKYSHRVIVHQKAARCHTADKRAIRPSDIFPDYPSVHPSIQTSSIIINHHQSSSIIINHHQSSSIIYTSSNYTILHLIDKKESSGHCILIMLVEPTILLHGGEIDLVLDLQGAGCFPQRHREVWSRWIPVIIRRRILADEVLGGAWWAIFARTPVQSNGKQFNE
jgi:hypothetical protein